MQRRSDWEEVRNWFKPEFKLELGSFHISILKRESLTSISKMLLDLLTEKISGVI